MMGLFTILACIIASSDARMAIVGGYLVPRIHDMLYVVSVQYPENQNACAAGFIRNRFVLTAARCVIDHNGEFIHGRIYVRARAVYLHSNYADPVIINVIRIHVPSLYNPKSYVGDIAVLKLSGGLREDSPYWLELSDDQPQRLVRKIVITAGFGWNDVRPSRRGNVTGNSDGLLRYGRGYILSNAKCEESYPQGMINSAIHVCAQLLCGAPCSGDNGGLLVRNHKESGKNRTVIGVLIKRSPICDESHQPGLYTRVSSYRQFIDDAIAGKNSSRIRVHSVPFH